MKWRTGSFTSQVTHEMSNFPPVSLANFLWKSATQVRHPSIPSIPSIPSNGPFLYSSCQEGGQSPINSINSIKRAFSIQFLPGRRAKPPSIPSIPSNEPFLYSSCQEGGQSPHQFHQTSLFYAVPARKEGKAPISSNQFHQTSLFYTVLARKEGKAPINSINSINSIKRAFSIQFLPGRRAKPLSIPSIPSNEPFLCSSCQEGGQSPHQSINSALSGEGVPVPCPVSSTGFVWRPWVRIRHFEALSILQRAGRLKQSLGLKSACKSLQMALRGRPASNFVPATRRPALAGF